MARKQERKEKKAAEHALHNQGPRSYDFLAQHSEAARKAEGHVVPVKM